MANRIILLVSVVLAAVALAATSTSAAPAADECLARPKDPPPAGKHWYYRTNRAIQRKCWYLGDEGETIAAVTPPKRSVSATPVETGQKIGMQWPSANARAELIDEPRAEQPAAPSTQPQLEVLQGAPDGGASTRNWVLASRWPDSSNAFSADPATMRNDPAPASRIENSSAVLAAAPVEPAEQPSVAVDNYIDAVSVAQFTAALVLVVIAIVGGAIFMSFVSRRRDRRNSSSQQRVTRNVMHRDEMQRDEMPWTRSRGTTAPTPAPVARVPEQNSLSHEIEEMDRLLEIARQARVS